MSKLKKAEEFVNVYRVKKRTIPSVSCNTAVWVDE